jgi:hypothetical protein
VQLVGFISHPIGQVNHVGANGIDLVQITRKAQQRTSLSHLIPPMRLNVRFKRVYIVLDARRVHLQPSECYRRQVCGILISLWYPTVSNGVVAVTGSGGSSSSSSSGLHILCAFELGAHNHAREGNECVMYVRVRLN